MIRKELKIDPIAYVSKNLKGIDLSLIEELYLVNKCPELFSFIIYPNILTEKLYIHKCERNADIDIRKLKSRNSIRKALKKSPHLCTLLDVHKYKDEILQAISMLDRMGDSKHLIDLLTSVNIDDDIVRKILFLQPRLIMFVANNPSINITSDIEMFIISSNPLLIKHFRDGIHRDTANYISQNHIVTTSILANYIHKSDIDILEKYVIEEAIRCKNNIQKLPCIIDTLKCYPEMFEGVIKSLYKNGLDYGNDYIIKYLLKECSHLINDQLASFIIEMQK